jgi:histo-blood group ABO system transferase
MAGRESRFHRRHLTGHPHASPMSDVHSSTHPHWDIESSSVSLLHDAVGAPKQLSNIDMESSAAAGATAPIHTAKGSLTGPKVIVASCVRSMSATKYNLARCLRGFRIAGTSKTCSIPIALAAVCITIVTVLFASNLLEMPFRSRQATVDTQNFQDIDSVNANQDEMRQFLPSTYHRVHKVGCSHTPFSWQHRVSAVITAWNPSRRDNIVKIVGLVSRSCIVGEIVIVNNNPDNTVLHRLILPVVRSLRVQIINANSNLITRAKYTGCKAASLDVCYLIDDDWMPMHLASLYASFLRNPNSVHVITNPLTYLMDLRYSFFDWDNNLHAGFAWIGVGSMFARSAAVDFLEKWNSILPRGLYDGYEDIFFCFWMNNPPVVLPSHIIALEKNDAKFALSAQHVYIDFEQRCMYEALHTLRRYIDMLPSALTKTEFDARELSVPCDGDLCSFFTNIIDNALTTENTVPMQELLPQQNVMDGSQLLHFRWDENFDADISTKFTTSPPHHAVDGLPSTLWQPISIPQQRQYFGLAYHQPQLILEIHAVGGPRSFFSYDVLVQYKDCGILSPTEATRTRTASSSSSNSNSNSDSDLKAPAGSKAACDSTPWSTVASSQFTCSNSEHSSDSDDIFHCSLDLGHSPLLATHIRLVIQSSGQFKLAEFGATLWVDPIVHNVEHPYTLVAVVMTEPGDYERRMAVRNTWARYAPDDTRVLFVLASVQKDLWREAATHKDMLFLGVVESYDTLLDKTIACFTWLDDHLQYTYALKVDIDSFVRTDALLAELAKLPTTRLYMGHFFRTQEVYHDPAEKNFEMGYTDCEHYPPYASGSGYVLSSDLVSYLANSPLSIRKLRAEDAAIGVWLSGYQVQREHSDFFFPEPPADCRSKTILIHRQPLQNFYTYYHNSLTGDMCVTVDAAAAIETFSVQQNEIIQASLVPNGAEGYDRARFVMYTPSADEPLEQRLASIVSAFMLAHATDRALLVCWSAIDSPVSGSTKVTSPELAAGHAHLSGSAALHELLQLPFSVSCTAENVAPGFLASATRHTVNVQKSVYFLQNVRYLHTNQIYSQAIVELTNVHGDFSELMMQNPNLGPRLRAVFGDMPFQAIASVLLRPSAIALSQPHVFTMANHGGTDISDVHGSVVSSIENEHTVAVYLGGASWDCASGTQTPLPASRREVTAAIEYVAGLVHTGHNMRVYFPYARSWVLALFAETLGHQIIRHAASVVTAHAQVAVMDRLSKCKHLVILGRSGIGQLAAGMRHENVFVVDGFELRRLLSTFPYAAWSSRYASHRDLLYREKLIQQSAVVLKAKTRIAIVLDIRNLQGIVATESTVASLISACEDVLWPHATISYFVPNAWKGTSALDTITSHIHLSRNDGSDIFFAIVNRWNKLRHFDYMLVLNANDVTPKDLRTATIAAVPTDVILANCLGGARLPQIWGGKPKVLWPLVLMLTHLIPDPTTINTESAVCEARHEIFATQMKAVVAREVAANVQKGTKAEDYDIVSFNCNNPNGIRSASAFTWSQCATHTFGQRSRVAVLLMATGKYREVAFRMIVSSQVNLLVEHDVTYYIFTDDQLDITAKQLRTEYGVVAKTVLLKEAPFKWPTGTLKRYHAYLNHWDELKHNDYFVALDADMAIVAPVGDELLVPMFACQHPGFVAADRKDYTYETRPESTAYIPPDKGTVYVAGGVYGGDREHMLHLLETQRDAVDADLAKDIIAVWHDESHQNRFFAFNPPTRVFSASYVYPEPPADRAEPYHHFFVGDSFEPKETMRILALNKDHDAIRS